MYSCFSQPACKLHLFCAVLYCHLWPFSLYHTFPQTTERELHHSVKSTVQRTFKGTSAKTLAKRTSQKTWSDSTANTPEWPRRKAVVNFRVRYWVWLPCDTSISHNVLPSLMHILRWTRRDGPAPYVQMQSSIFNIWKSKILRGSMSNGCIMLSTYPPLEKINTFPHDLINGKIFINKLKKVKWSRYRPGVAQKVGRGIALLFHDRGTRRGWVVSSTPRPHSTPVKDPVPIVQETEWAPGPVWTGGKSRPHRDDPGPSRT